MRHGLALAALLLIPTLAVSADPAKPKNKPDTPEFYIYKNLGSRDNHFIASGWMSSNPTALSKVMKLNPNWKDNPKSEPTCLHITYNIDIDTATTWAGIYWQFPANNWATSKLGYDLSAYKRLTFWARGSGYIEKFGVGGTSSAIEEGDSGESSVGPIDLTPEWKQYTIDLSDVDLRHIIGGFLFSTSAEYNTKNVDMYLDEVRFER